MEQNPSPIDIARQALKTLVQNKTAPTPDNFRKVYDEIAGAKSEDIGQILAKLLKEAGQRRPKFARLATELPQAVAKSDWAAVEKHLRQLLPAGAGTASWSEVVRELVREMEISRPGITLGKKKEGMERVLVNFGADAEVLAEKLSGLVNSWKSGGTPTAALSDAPPTAIAEGVEDKKTAPSADGLPVQASVTAALWRDILIRTLEFGLVSQLKYVPELLRHAEELLAQARQARTEKDVSKLGDAFKAFWFKLEMNSDAQSRLHEELLQVLRLLIDNMSELVVDDSWLHGQTAMIRDIMEGDCRVLTY